MKQFKKYLFEFLVIVTGVTTSFLVEEWREHRDEREREHVYISQLLDDVSDFKRGLHNIDVQIKLGLNHISKVRNYKIADRDSLLWYACSVYYLHNTNLKLGTFETLKSTGDIRLIGDKKLIQSIYRFIGRYDYSVKVFDAGEWTLRNRLFPIWWKYKTATDGRNFQIGNESGRDPVVMINDADYQDALSDIEMKNQIAEMHVDKLFVYLDDLETQLQEYLKSL